MLGQPHSAPERQATGHRASRASAQVTARVRQSNPHRSLGYVQGCDAQTCQRRIPLPPLFRLNVSVSSTLRAARGCTYHMSRGPGRVQKIITDLIASNPHGAWSVTELCKHIYPDAHMEKKHRVAVTRRRRPDGVCSRSGDKAMSTVSITDAIWRAHCVTLIWAGGAKHPLTSRRGRTGFRIISRLPRTG